MRHSAPTPRPAGPAFAMYDDLARRWSEAGRPAPSLTRLETAVGLWWLSTPAVERLHDSRRANDLLLHASAQHARKNPNWYADLMREARWCPRGHGEWRIINVAFCTNCVAEYAPCCAAVLLVECWPNGNAVCPACRNGEVVG